MKLLIISAGPGLDEIKSIYGHAINWISSIINDKSVLISTCDIYDNSNFDETEFDAWIITGSAYSVLDNDNWILLLKEKIKYAYNNGIPVLGICFGHQIICQALGGKVKKNHLGWELGSNKISFNQNGLNNKIFKNIDIDDYFYFSHEDVVVSLPNSAIKLASNEMGLQSYVINDLIYGVQFHPEFTKNIMQKYVDIRFDKGIINEHKQVLESKTSHMVISNFINICKEII